MRVWAKDEFKKAKPVDRMYMHLMNKRRYPLAPKEADYLAVLTSAYAIICEHPQRIESIRLIEKVIEHTTWHHNPQKVYQDACNLYARFSEINVKLERALQRDRLFALKAEVEKSDNPDYYLMLEIEKQLTKVMRIDQPDNEEPMSTELPPVIFSDDPTLLLSAEVEDAELDEE